MSSGSSNSFVLYPTIHERALLRLPEHTITKNIYDLYDKSDFIFCNYFMILENAVNEIGYNILNSDYIVREMSKNIIVENFINEIRDLSNEDNRIKCPLTPDDIDDYAIRLFNIAVSYKDNKQLFDFVFLDMIVENKNIFNMFQYIDFFSEFYVN